MVTQSETVMVAVTLSFEDVCFEHLVVDCELRLTVSVVGIVVDEIVYHKDLTMEERSTHKGLTVVEESTRAEWEVRTVVDTEKSCTETKGR